jgi:hypothetical protein
MVDDLTCLLEVPRFVRGPSCSLSFQATPIAARSETWTRLAAIDNSRACAEAVMEQLRRKPE